MNAEDAAAEDSAAEDAAADDAAEELPEPPHAASDVAIRPANTILITFFFISYLLS